MIEITKPDGTKIVVSTAEEYAIVMATTITPVEPEKGAVAKEIFKVIAEPELEIDGSNYTSGSQMEIGGAKTIVLHPSYFRIFCVIRDMSPDPIHSGDIQSLLPDLNKGTISQACNELKKKGLIKRTDGHWGYILTEDCLVKYNVIRRITGDNNG